jgi:hypothetical protein
MITALILVPCRVSPLATSAEEIPPDPHEAVDRFC